MKTLEELAKTNERLAMTLPSDITDFETKIFSAIEQIAVESSEGIGLVRVKDLEGEATDSVTVPKEQSPLVPTDVAEGNTVTPSKVLLDKKAISLSKRWGEGFALSQDAIDDCHVELINLGLESVGKGFAQKLDEFIFQGLLRETEYSETLAGLGAHGIYTLAHKPLTRVITATNDDVPPVAVTVESQDEYDGKVAITESLLGKNLVIKYRASAHTLIRDAKTDRILEYEDLTAAFYLSRNHYEIPKVVVMNPHSYADIIKDTRFISAYQGTGAQAPVVSNEIGQVAGLRIVVTTRMPEGIALELDTKRFWMLLKKGRMHIKRREEPSSDSYEFYFFQRVGGDTINEFASAIITNLGSKSADL
jgi:hypothetical protein